ncbi:MAG: tetratricopeptide repeat protein [Spirochaetes bacterium]|nr:tetratricopeptide repeat protein [Spirochaetota bacterium]
MKKIIITLNLCLIIACVAWLDPYRDRVSEGNAQFHQKKYDEARKGYNAAEKYAPGEAEKKKLRFNHGGARYMQGDFEGSADEFREALKSGDRDVQKKALFNMGNAFLKKGDVEQAVSAYMGALAVDPSYLPAKKNIEYLLKKKEPPKDGRQDQQQKGGDNDDKKDKNRQGKQGDDTKDKGGQDKGQAQAKMSKEQLKSILESMKNSPVRRQRGKSGGEMIREKSW